MSFTAEDVRKLIVENRGPCISIFMPTHRSGRETQQDRIRLKNLLRGAEDRLKAAGLAPRDCSHLLEPALRFESESGGWNHPKDGLALFVAGDGFHTFRVPVALPERVVIGPRFLIRPLLPLLHSLPPFHVLWLSQHEIHLLRIVGDEIMDLDLAGHVPASLSEAVGTDFTQKSVQFHTGTPRAGPKRRAAIFFGGGTDEKEIKKEIEGFCRRVDVGLQKLLAGFAGPLVIAAVDYLIPIYRSVSRLPDVCEHGIEGSLDAYTPQALRDRAVQILEPRLRAAEEQALQGLQNRLGTGRASISPTDILPAALEGRIDTLFIATDGELRGSFDVKSRRLVVEDDDRAEDLLDRAAFECLRHRGAVYVRPLAAMPEGAPAAAAFRY
jgi:hypothetical protein